MSYAWLTPWISHSYDVDGLSSASAKSLSAATNMRTISNSSCLDRTDETVVILTERPVSCGNILITDRQSA